MRKVHFWEIWDWKSIRGGIGLVLLFLIAFLFMDKYPDFIRKGKSSETFRIINGSVISIKPIEGMSQSPYLGNTTTRDYYAIDYSYFVDGQSYVGKDKIPNSFSNLNFIARLMRGERKLISIRYNPNEPGKSQVIIEK